MSASFKIELGRGAQMDARTLVDTRMLVAGSSGSGKSYAMRLIAEQTASRLQTIVLDPEGEYTTLREKADLVIVATDGEVVPTVQTAAKLARKLLELKVSAVVDLYDLKLADRRAYVRRFLESMMSAPKKLWRPCLVMLDEAHKFCPERSSGQAESTDAVITLLSQGRKRGFCGILSTQRLQKLHKDAAAETLNNLIGRTSLDTDVRRARDILGVAKGDEQKLRSLEPGNWFAFGPAFTEVTGVCRFKARRATTTHPQPGMRHKLTAPAPSDRILKVLPELAELPQEAANEARDLEETRARVRGLERELKAARRNGAADPSAVQRAVDRAVAKLATEQSKRLTIIARDLGKLQAGIDKASGCLDLQRTQLAQLRQAVSSSLSAAEAPTPKEPVVPRAAVRQRHNDEPESRAGNGELGGGMRRIMLAIASSGGASRGDVAIMARLTPKSGTYSTYLGRLKRLGYIAEKGTHLVPTDAGISALGSYEPMPISGDDLIEVWAPELGSGGTRRIFDALAEAREVGLERDALAEAAGLQASSGTFSTYIGRLRRKGIVVGKWPLRLAEVFFA